MLGESDIAGFLLSEHPLLRDHALRHFSLAGERSSVTADQALSVIGRFGTLAFADPEMMVDLPQTVPSVSRVMRWLTIPGHPQWAAGWLVALPQSLLADNPAWAAQCPDASIGARLARRLEMHNQDPQKLWRELETLHSDRDRMHDLVCALGRHDEFLMPRVISALARPGSPIESPAIELAGRAHLGSVMPAIVDRLDSADDAMAEVAMQALARIGTAGVVATVEQRCGLASVPFRTRAAVCFARFRVPSVEGTLLRMMSDEDDAGVRVRLCQTLADICTTAGFDRLYNAVKDIPHPAMPNDCTASVAALARMLGKKLPDSERWEGQPRRRVESYASPPAAAGSSPPSTMPESSSLHFPADGEELRDAPPAGSSVRTPIRRSETKVGRNDPCPCGSGKKYKKCCGA